MDSFKLEWLVVLEDRKMEKEGVDDNSYLDSMQAHDRVTENKAFLILGRDRVDEALTLLIYCSIRGAPHREKKDS